MKFFPKSLRLRVTLNVFATSLLVILLIGGMLFSQMNIVTQKLAYEKLLNQAQRIASYIEYDWKGSLELDVPRGYDAYFTSGESGQFAVFDTQGRLLFRSDGFQREQIKGLQDKGAKYFFHYDAQDGHRFIGIKYDYLFEDRVYPIYVIEDEAEFTQVLSEVEKDFLSNILGLAIPLLLLQTLLLLFIFRQAFRPLIRAASSAKKIKYDNLSFRLDESAIPIEVRPLVNSINNSLARLEKSVEAQKFFIANAAHELRTPVSILKARISSMSAESTDTILLHKDLRNINHLIGQMLDISRLELAESAPKEDVSLNALARRACEDIGALYVEQGRELSLEEKSDHQVLYGNEETLYRAVLNLLENALKHTPDETPVEVIVVDNKIIVRDYGDPIPDEHRAKIFEKFEKMPKSSGVKGAGLGLSIVQKAVEIHDALIVLVAREDGNDFILDFT